MLIIDRFEGDLAVCETEDGLVRILRADLPTNAREGSVLVRMDNAWVLDLHTEAQRRARLLEMQEDLFR